MGIQLWNTFITNWDYVVARKDMLAHRCNDFKKLESLCRILVQEFLLLKELDRVRYFGKSRSVRDSERTFVYQVETRTLNHAVKRNKGKDRLQCSVWSAGDQIHRWVPWQIPHSGQQRVLSHRSFHQGCRKESIWDQSEWRREDSGGDPCKDWVIHKVFCG